MRSLRLPTSPETSSPRARATTARARLATRSPAASMVRAVLVMMGVGLALGWLAAGAWILIQMVSWWVQLPTSFPLPGGRTWP